MMLFSLKSRGVIGLFSFWVAGAAFAQATLPQDRNQGVTDGGVDSGTVIDDFERVLRDSSEWIRAHRASLSPSLDADAYGAAIPRSKMRAQDAAVGSDEGCAWDAAAQV